MATVEINSLDEAKAAAAVYGVDWPSGRGKPPVVRLWNAVTEAGDTITGTYVSEPKTRLATAAPGERDYDISRTVMVERQTKSGKRKMPSKETVRLNVREIRDLVNNNGVRGRVSRSNILGALAKLQEAGSHAQGWSFEDIFAAKIVPVTPKTPTKPKAASKAKDLVSVDASGPEDTSTQA